MFICSVEDKKRKFLRRAAAEKSEITAKSIEETKNDLENLLDDDDDDDDEQSGYYE